MFNGILIAIRFIILVFNAQKQLALENGGASAAVGRIQAEAKRPKLRGEIASFGSYSG